MTSKYEDPSTWRLRTSNGIPYRYFDSSGMFGAEAASASEIYLIQATDLLAFVQESFPEPIPFQSFVYQEAPRGMPGAPPLRTKTIKFKGHIPGKPIDPYGTDPGAPNGTYQDILEVTIDYEVTPQNDQSSSDPSNPETFLQISAATAGEYIAIPSPAAKWSDGTPVTDPSLAATKMIPTTEWSVKWPRIPSNLWTDEVIDKLRKAEGMVNTEEMPLFRNASAGTILFTGYDYDEEYTWRSGANAKPPITVNMKFLEKHIKVVVLGVTVVLGHNWFYRKDQGVFEVLYPTGDITGDTTYMGVNLNNIFSVDGVIGDPVPVA